MAHFQNFFGSVFPIQQIFFKMRIKADQNIDAVLCLSDKNGEKNYFFGKRIGKSGKAIGEICFNTSITGYQEILTDPSYCGQIINFTFPHIGNVGCNFEDAESKKIAACGLIVREELTKDSNYRSKTSLNQWLIENNITGICNIDTRKLTRLIRTKGACNAIIKSFNIGEEINTDELIAEIRNLPDLNGAELATKVTTQNLYNWNEKSYKFNQDKYHSLEKGKYNVVVMDFGVKTNILRCLTDQEFDVKIVSATTSFEEIAKLNPDGVFLSNGPGDPDPTAKYAATVIKKIIDNNIPLFGICMGHQLLALALGLKTVKMHQGHRGANHPVKNLLTGTIEITSQNHGFCVENKNLPANVEVTHISLFDGTIEGIRLKDKPAFSVQYHPESSPGPNDSKYLFEQFKEMIDKNKNN